MKKNKKYSLEFKQSILREIENGSVSLAEQSRHHGIAAGLISYWKKQDKDGKLSASPDRKVRDLEKEVESLKSTIGDLYRQVEAFKKSEADEQRRKSVSSSIITAESLARSKKPVKR